MENKYYDLIISLIKEHKKYSGLENILEDIANDVSLKAQNVINSIDNEDVIKDYLNKVISCSIHTVSKRMGYKRRESISLPQTLTVEKKEIIEAKDIAVNEDCEINESIDVSAVSEDLELSVNNEEHLELVEEVQLPEEEIVLLDQDSVKQEEFLEIDTDLETLVEEVEVQNNTSVDVALVDKMINGVETNVVLTEDFSPVEVVESIEEIAFMDAEEDLNAETFVNTEESVLPTLEEDFEINIEETTSELMEPVIENFDEEVGFLEDFSNDNSLEINVEDQEVIDIGNNQESIEETINLVEENDEADVLEDKLAFPVFANFEIENIEADSIDSEGLVSSLKDLNTLNPEMLVLQISNLKFKQNLSVKNISDSLGITQELVLKTLNEIVVTMKD